MASPDLDRLIDEVFELAWSTVAAGDPFGPFAHVGYGGRTSALAIVVADGAHMPDVGRRSIREAAASGADRYAMVYEAVLRDPDGTRRDVLVIEAARVGDAMARRIARMPDGERRPMGDAPNALVPLDPLDLEWGTVTPDAIAPDGAAVYFVMHQIDKIAARSRTSRFVRARLRFHRRRWTAGTVQRVIVDDRGQDVDDRARNILRNQLRREARWVRFLSER